MEYIIFILLDKIFQFIKYILKMKKGTSKKYYVK